MLHVLQDGSSKSFNFQHNLNVIFAQFPQTLHESGHFQFQMEQLPVEEEPRIHYGPWKWYAASIVAHRCGFDALHEQCTQVNATKVNAWELILFIKKNKELN